MRHIHMNRSVRVVMPRLWPWCNRTEQNRTEQKFNNHKLAA